MAIEKAGGLAKFSHVIESVVIVVVVVSVQAATDQRVVVSRLTL